MAAKDFWLGRISVNWHDRGHAAQISCRTQGYRAMVRLNGEPVFGVITADSEAGLIVRHKLDASGKPIYDKDRGELVDEVVHGKVEIELQPEICL